MSRYHYREGIQKNRHIALDLVSTIFFGFFLFLATIAGGVASFYLNQILH